MTKNMAKDMYIGDLHIHSRYSRATSREATPEYLDLWAAKKGIDIVGTGDFTHPAWRQELKEKLEPAEDGLYTLKKEYRIGGGRPDRAPRFVVTGEISSIYKKNDRVYKVHSLILLPGLEEADALARRLELIGNIHSDGRPILGLDCRDLLEITLETCPEAIYVPAHIWTPHFSLFGAFSGFQAIEECYEDLTPQIHALETGLSSDPPMNWRISALDRFQLISNSDAHSPAKLGREANLFHIELSYQGLYGAIQRGDGLAGTIEFFPEEGKYHYDGHRKCGVCISPQQTARYQGRCPVCGKKITIGVQNRVEQLADRPEGYVPAGARPFESLVPLPEVIAASTGASASGKKVQEQYEKMLSRLGPEFSILRSVPVEDIRKACGPLVAEGISRLREGRVERTPGFDGEYGKIYLLSSEEISSLEGQLSLFSQEEIKRQEKAERLERAAGWPEWEQKQAAGDKPQENASPDDGEKTVPGLNPRQQEAVESRERAVAVIAGPGTGKTKTLVSRLQYLLEERNIDPCEITAVTFTNKAAEEMENRLKEGAAGKEKYGLIHVGTFHAICSRFLKEQGKTFLLADEGLQKELAGQTLQHFGRKQGTGKFLRELSLWKNGLPGENGLDGAQTEAYLFYQELLRKENALDYDDLLLETLKLLEKAEKPETSHTLKRSFTYLLIDEFQDINPLQYRLALTWNREGKELFVIGDPDQSIYGFRGSDAGCFDRLAEDFPELQRIRLEENYRSTPAILEGALAVISHNAGEKRRMTARQPDGLPIRVMAARDERWEAICVAKEINRQVGGIDMLDAEENGQREGRKMRSFSDLAVLYRTHRQAEFLEKCLRQEGIPYVVAGREDFLEEEKVRAALYFFRQVLSPEDEAAKKLCSRLLFSGEEGDGRDRLALLTEKYRKKIRKTRPVRLMEEWAEDVKLAEDGNLKKLTDMSVLHHTMEEFLHTVSFGEDGDVRRRSGRKISSGAVTLMTLHGSKGLEFPVVFLYGMDKGRMPLEFGGNAADLQEERRLCFVGMTRAREELILLHADQPSRFLEELPEKLTVRENAREEREEQAVEAVQLSLFDFMKV